MPKYIIDARGINKAYALENNNVAVLNGVDFTLDKGESAAIIGPSGAGKSTFLHILGLLERPNSGTLHFLGDEVGNLNEHQRAELRLQQVGFVFQFHHLLPEFSALENVLMPGLMLGLSKSECEDRASELLEQAGLADRLNHKPGELSGGEQQRVALSRALMNKPALLLADEPTGNLDSASSSKMQEMLKRLTTETGAALLIVTHNQELAQMTDKVYNMTEGLLSAE